MSEGQILLLVVGTLCLLASGWILLYAHNVLVLARQRLAQGWRIIGWDFLLGPVLVPPDPKPTTQPLYDALPEDWPACYRGKNPIPPP